MAYKSQWAGKWNLDTLDQVQSIEVDEVTRERRHKGNRFYYYKTFLFF